MFNEPKNEQEINFEKKHILSNDIREWNRSSCNIFLRTDYNMTSYTSLYLWNSKKLALYWKHEIDTTKHYPDKIPPTKILNYPAENKRLIYSSLNNLWQATKSIYFGVWI